MPSQLKWNACRFSLWNCCGFFVISHFIFDKTVMFCLIGGVSVVCGGGTKKGEQLKIYVYTAWNSILMDYWLIPPLCVFISFIAMSDVCDVYSVCYFSLKGGQGGLFKVQGGGFLNVVPFSLQIHNDTLKLLSVQSTFFYLKSVQF